MFLVQLPGSVLVRRLVSTIHGFTLRTRVILEDLHPFVTPECAEDIVEPEKLFVDADHILLVVEATKAQIEDAARIIACLRCLRRSRAYDFTRHVEIERIFGLLANAMGLAQEGLYIALPRGEIVHPYPVHILARELPGATRRPFIGRTHVVVEFRDKDDQNGELTRTTLEETLRRGEKGSLGNEVGGALKRTCQVSTPSGE